MHSMFDLIHLVLENVWLYGGAFILVLSVLVFIHEWGHYIIAVKCGVKVETFSIGFGREIYGFTDKYDTRWKIGLFPLGGYVKMFGDVDPASAGHTEQAQDKETGTARPFTEEEKARAFYAKSLGKRSAIVFAGPAINFLFAIFILAGLFIFYGQPVTGPVAAAVIADTPAHRAGFMPHDEVMSVGGREVERFDDIRREVMVALDTPTEFIVNRGGREITIIATPEKIEEEDRFGFKHSYGFLGIISTDNALEIEKIISIDGTAVEDTLVKHEMLIERLGTRFEIELDRGTEIDTLLIEPVAEMNGALRNPENPEYVVLYIAAQKGETFLKHSPLSGLQEAISETYSISMSTLQALGQIVTGTRSATELGGIIRIGALAGDMAKSGIVALVTFTALLSINLGLINLFPIPMLDGGHLFFYLIEAVRGAPLSDQIQEYAFRLGLVILVGIMVFANLNDIVQLIL
jgi:regulator of sigma E protease